MDSVNISTIKFIGILNDLSSRLQNGIIAFNDFSETSERYQIIYDSTKRDPLGFPIVLDCCVIDEHHDIVSYYDSYIIEECNLYPQVRLVLDEDNSPYIIVHVDSTTEFIVIESSWYF